MMSLFTLAAVAIMSTPFVMAVGVNHAANGDQPALSFADDDAVSAAELFGAPDRTVLLTAMDSESAGRFGTWAQRARPPTLSQIHTAAVELAGKVQAAQSAGERAVVLVWLVSHGGYDASGAPYLAMADGPLTPRRLLQDVITPLSIAHRVHVVVDACHADAVMKWRATAMSVDPQQVQQGFDSPGLTWTHVGVITAAGADERTFEWKRLRSGVFSALVRAALRGAANADGDECVTYAELRAYVSAALQAIALPEARPTIAARPPRQEPQAPLACAHWFGGTVELHEDLSRLGAFQIEDERGVWLAGGRTEPLHQSRLWLPAHQTLSVYGQDGKEWQLTQAANESYAVGDQPVESNIAQRGVFERAVEKGLFQVPYGPSYYRGFAAAVEGQSMASPSVVERDASRAPGPGRLLMLSSVPSLALGAAWLGVALAAAGGSGYSLYRYSQTRLEVPAQNALADWLYLGGLSLGAVLLSVLPTGIGLGLLFAGQILS